MDEAIAPNLDFGIPTPKPSAEQEEAIKEEQTLAALATHPGWTIVSANWKRQIMELRTMAGVDLSQKTDAEVGQLKRAYDLAAERMEQELIRVEQVAQIINNKTEK